MGRRPGRSALGGCILGILFTASPLLAQAAAGGSVPTWSVERVASTLGEPIPFGAVPPGGIRVDDDGRIHVLDVQAAAVYLFDSGLTPVGSLGGRGRGPGEFIQPSLLGVGSGSVAVFDPGPPASPYSSGARTRGT